MELTRNEKQFMTHKKKPVVAQPSVFHQSHIPSVITKLPALPSHIPSVVTTLPSNISSVGASIQTLPSIRPIPKATLSNNAIPNTSCLARVGSIPTTAVTQFPVIDITANIPQATIPSAISSKRFLKDNMQQTEISALNMKSVGIQCQLEEDFEDMEIVEENPPECKEADNIENAKDMFLKFVQENSTQYKNFRECLICGEICKTSKYFFSHMATHQGPMVLCFKCGFCFNNEDLLRKHNCVKTKLANRITLNCPHYRCRVKAISKLELYDHINEHDNYRPYKCIGCGKAFFTRQEFLRHILIRAKCYTQAKPKRYCIYNLDNQKDRLCRVRVFTLYSFKKRTILVTVFLSRRSQQNSICKICMRSIGNAKVRKTHHMKCVVKFRKRLMRKRLK